jgi:hypothetical protein
VAGGSAPSSSSSTSSHHASVSSGNATTPSATAVPMEIRPSSVIGLSLSSSALIVTAQLKLRVQPGEDKNRTQRCFQFILVVRCKRAELPSVGQAVCEARARARRT